GRTKNGDWYEFRRQRPHGRRCGLTEIRDLYPFLTTAPPPSRSGHLHGYTGFPPSCNRTFTSRSASSSMRRHEDRREGSHHGELSSFHGATARSSPRRARSCTGSAKAATP